MMRVKVMVKNNQKTIKVPVGIRMLIRRCCQAVLVMEQFPHDAEVSVSFVSNAEIRNLNRIYRKKDSVTDVLSFPLGVDGKYDISKVQKGEGVKALMSWIQGKRTSETNWCDWNIPLHWGGVSDPFQPCERYYRMSYNALRVFAETKYPFVVSTKGRIIAEPEYLELLRKCNCVVQISMVCSSYDKLEEGAPTFEERLEIARKVAPNVKRLIVRIQPYMHEVYGEVYENLEKFKAAGAYGVIVEGMKFASKRPGLVKVAGDYTYPKALIESDILKLKQRAHELGLALYSGENRTRELGDSLCCCGVSDLPGFKVNEYNLNHMLHGGKPAKTPQMQKTGTAMCFQSLYQNTANSRRLRGESFESEMLNVYKTKRDYVNETFGLK